VIWFRESPRVLVAACTAFNAAVPDVVVLVLAADRRLATVFDAGLLPPDGALDPLGLPHGALSDFDLLVTTGCFSTVTSSSWTGTRSSLCLNRGPTVRSATLTIRLTPRSVVDR
jgi:hypothetical protein